MRRPLARSLRLTRGPAPRRGHAPRSGCELGGSGHGTPLRMRAVAAVAALGLVTIISPVSPRLTSTRASKHAASRPEASLPDAYPTASTTLRSLATYPAGLRSALGGQVLADGGRDVFLLFEDDVHSTGACIHDQVAEVEPETGKLRLGPVVACYAWLFRSGTGQVYLGEADRQGTELLEVKSVTKLVKSDVTGLSPSGFMYGAPVSGTDLMWLPLEGRIALFDLTTGKVLRSLRLPSYVSGRPWGLALAGPGGPLYVTFSRTQAPAWWFCAMLAKVDLKSGAFIVRRSLDDLSGLPVATAGGVFVGMGSGGTGTRTQVYSADGLRPLSGSFIGTEPYWLTATGDVVWWSAGPPAGGSVYCGWITKQGSFAYLALQFKRFQLVWGNPLGIEPGTGDLLLSGSAVGRAKAVYGLIAIATPPGCREHM